MMKMENESGCRLVVSEKSLPRSNVMIYLERTSSLCCTIPVSCTTILHFNLHRSSVILFAELIIAFYRPLMNDTWTDNYGMFSCFSCFRECYLRGLLESHLQIQGVVINIYSENRNWQVRRTEL